MKSVITLMVLSVLLIAQEYYYEYGKKVELNEIKRDISQAPSRDIKSRHFETKSGQNVSVNDEIIVVCNDVLPCQKAFKNYHVKQIRALSSTIFLLQLENSSELFSTSQDLYNESSIKSAHPNFRKKKVLR